MKLASTGYPGKLRPSAAQISEFATVSNRTICPWTSRTSEVENGVSGSRKTARPVDATTVTGGKDVNTVNVGSDRRAIDDIGVWLLIWSVPTNAGAPGNSWDTNAAP